MRWNRSLDPALYGGCMPRLHHSSTPRPPAAGGGEGGEHYLVKSVMLPIVCCTGLRWVSTANRHWKA